MVPDILYEFMSKNIFKIVYNITNFIYKPVLRGHLWDNDRVVFKIGDLLKEVQFIWQHKKKMTA